LLYKEKQIEIKEDGIYLVNVWFKDWKI
jgi:hypothetical protein